MTKTKIALAAVLFAAASSTAFAQGFDPDLSNRYQGYAAPGAALQSAPVRLQKQRTVVQPETATSTGQSEFDTDRFDRASSPYAGGN